jgi:hypothetical protein
MLIATDITDPATGEPLYVTVKRRPLWWWLWKRACLLCGIAWRRWDDNDETRISLGTALAVAAIVYPMHDWSSQRRWFLSAVPSARPAGAGEGEART